MVLLDHFLAIFRRDRLRLKQVGIIMADILLGKLCCCHSAKEAR